MSRELTLSMGTSDGTYRLRQALYNLLTHEVEITIIYDGSRTSDQTLCVLQKEELRPHSNTYGWCTIINEEGSTAVGYCSIDTNGVIRQRVTSGNTKRINIKIKYIV